jgi:quercetin dioxygenase-like cupin family protein
MSELAESNISLVNNVFIKQMVFKAQGDVALTHAHVYDHQTLLSVGILNVTVEGIATIYQAPAIIVIQAGKHHCLEAMQAGTVAYCIHALNGSECVDEAESLVLGVPNTALHHLA